MAAGYVECFSRIWETAVIEWRLRGPTKNFLPVFFAQLQEYGDISVDDILITLLLGVLFTLVRYLVTELAFKPIAQHFEFIPKDRKKFPESAWKILYYASAYSYSSYILFSGKYNYFQHPEECWEGWTKGMSVPIDIYTIYVVEAGFYFHSIYATIFMDKWRADTIVMICHHLLANALILFSYAFRYHNIGLIVLFLHDISDIFLEGTKISLCFKSRPGGPHRISDALVNVGFLGFAISWFVCRLYFYPHKVLYAGGHSARTLNEKNLSMPFYFFFNGMLWLLFAMNIWWFHFILLLIWRVMNGSARQVEDTREVSSEISDSVVEEEELNKEETLANGTANGPVLTKKIHNDKPPTKANMNGDIKTEMAEKEADEEKDAHEKDDGQQEKEYLRRRKRNMQGN